MAHIFDVDSVFLFIVLSQKLAALYPLELEVLEGNILDFVEPIFAVIRHDCPADHFLFDKPPPFLLIFVPASFIAVVDGVESSLAADNFADTINSEKELG